MDDTLHRMVINAATVHKNRKAVCFQPYDGPPIFHTYELMMLHAEELAHFLTSQFNGLQKCVVGLYCQPGIHLPSWIIGILQVPAAYSPVDPTAPAHFTSSLMERCKMHHILVENSRVEFFRQLFPDCTEQDSSTVQHLDITLFKAVRREIEIVSSTNCPDEAANIKNQLHVTSSDMPLSTQCIDLRENQCLAYILHTSGTTGIPKIVCVPHSCIVPNIHHLKSIFSMSPDDLVFLASPLTFDPSVIEMFLALSAGACLLIVPEPLKMMPEKLLRLLFGLHRVTLLQVTPTFLRRFSFSSIRSSVLSRDSSLRVLALGGEQFPPINVLRSWKESSNKTRIFNLYGITEVSSWATYYEIPQSVLHSQSGDDPAVPLGKPLDGTIVEVRNEENTRIEEGEGQVFLGGRQRICFLDEEVSLPCGTMRRTGDWVRLQDGDMYFMGRRDNQFKRHGKRLNTEYVQQVVEGLEVVEACAVLWSEAEQLILFVVPTKSANKKALWRAVQTNLLSYAMPDDLVLIEALPHTLHGKIDFSRLSLLYGDHLREKMSKPETQKEPDVWKSLQTLWKASLGLPEDNMDVAKDSVLLLSGGDSLKAIRFHEEVEALLGKQVPGLLDIILNDTILAIYRRIIKFLCSEKENHKISPQITEVQNENIVMENHTLSPQIMEVQNQNIVMENHTIRPQIMEVQNENIVMENHTISPQIMEVQNENIVMDMNTKYVRKRKADVSSSQEDSSCILSVSRGSRFCTHGRPTAQHGQIQPGSDQDDNGTVHKHAKSTSSPALLMSLRQAWASDTSKCVDASPLLVSSVSNSSSVTVYIGSHSHRMQALDLHTGTILWERVLGDRIESSAALSLCGSYVIVGCYDGGVYALRRSDGATHWIFSTGDAVKSSPTLDSISGLAYVGSHDQHVYALDIEGKQCTWKTHCQAGAVFSSPCVSLKPHHVYAATLGGLVLALDPATGRRLWKFDVGKPVFSSPQCSQDHVVFGSVDTKLYCLSHWGEKLWQLSTEGPIFSSPCVSTHSKQVLFGSHDGSIYCCSPEGELLWRYKTSSRVYATPFVFPNPHAENTELLAAASTDGALLLLDTHSGLLIGHCTLEGEVFSSPVVYNNHLLIGCRNNFIYCFDLISNSQQKGDTKSIGRTASRVT
ncbi:beta-alanine-activating enzyme isoform X2 [Hyperolius riggenbachi]